jgi:hypothetical protein
MAKTLLRNTAAVKLTGGLQGDKAKTGVYIIDW